MKELIMIFCAVLTLTACGDSIEKKAGEKLAAARAAYETGNYEEAKRQIDSIKVLYPKAFEARKAGQQLMMEVETMAMRKAQASLDSALQAKQQAFEAIKGKFVLEKDVAYQQVGNYLCPSQVVERNLHRSYLRFQVNELGEMSMTSVYCGVGSIHHHGVKVTTPDGNSAATPQTKDSYETTDLGEKIEKADYRLGEDGGVIDFICTHKDRNIRVEFVGDRRYTTTMLPADRAAAANVHELADILAAMQQIKEEQKAVALKLRFIEEKGKKEGVER